LTLCKYFIVDPIGFGDGIGKCQLLEDYKAKGATEAMCEKVRREQLRTTLLYRACCHEDRDCFKYEPINQ